MPKSTAQPQEYDPRWFIWTIVFLVVTGISLVSYIVLSDNGTENIYPNQGPRMIMHPPKDLSTTANTTKK